MGACMKKSGFPHFFDFGAPGEIRTPDRSVRSRVLYPAELRVHDMNNIKNLVKNITVYVLKYFVHIVVSC